VGRMKGTNYLSTQHARLTARRGMGRAAVAAAIRCSFRRTTSCSETSPTPSSARTGWLAGTTRGTPAD
jgi:hypothetical protein